MSSPPQNPASSIVLEPCSLCDNLQGQLIFDHALFRVVRVTAETEADYPAFYRLVWRAHVRELSDLLADDLALCMRAVVVMERCLREQLSPTPAKINLATLGNVVPHLHWHVVARYEWDAHWPKPVWASAERGSHAGTLAQLTAQLGQVDRLMAQQLGAELGGGIR